MAKQSIRQKVSQEILAADERAIQSTFVYQILVMDRLALEYEKLEMKVNKLLDTLGIPEGPIEERLALAAKEF